MAKWFKRLLLASSIGLFGILIHVSSLGFALEEKFGLYVLFQLRGPIPAPDSVAVIAIDQPSATQFDLPITPRSWPREMHARLIEKLTQAGARLIIFDLIFDKPSEEPENDVKLAKIMQETGNVILIERLVYQDTALFQDNSNTSDQRIIQEGPAKLLPIIAAATLTRAPFPLPKAERVNNYWTFKSNAGDLPTVPVIALQYFAQPAITHFIRLLHAADPDLATQIPELIHPPDIDDLSLTLRNLFISHPQLVAKIQMELSRDTLIDTADKKLILSLLNLYSGEEIRYLNFYGPPRSITTIPYYKLFPEGFDGEIGSSLHHSINFQGKVVFVGFSGATQPEQDIVRDDYHTVYSNPDGLFISGVEIAATAFANLLENKPVRPFPILGSSGFLFLFGFGLTIIFLALPKRWAVIAGFIFTVMYVINAYYQFKEAGFWLPLINPILLQAPLALFCAVSIKYYDAKRERQQLKEAFGYFLPDRVVNDIAKSAGAITLNNQLVYGTCLATDAAMYTALAEKMDPRQLGQLMNDYYAELFEPVKQHQGMVSDVVGDAMLAIWAAPNAHVSLRKQACLAGLEMICAIDRFNQNENRPQLPTRIGLHFGEMLLGHVGAIHHYEYRAVGDMVNTANRIQSANKILGTRLLASYEVLAGLDEFLTRPLGNFLLPGKSTPVHLAELITEKQFARDEQIWLCDCFADALQAYQLQLWIDASQGFLEILKKKPHDGPAQFFLQQCQKYLLTPPIDSWNAILQIHQK